MNAFLNKLANIWVLLLTVLLFLSFPLYFLPQHKAQTDSYSQDAGFIDLCFFPSIDRIYEIAAAYGEEGRSTAIGSWLSLDMVWPLVYSFFFLVCINLCIGAVHGQKARLLALFALLPLVLDYCENMLGIVIMTSFPARLPAAALGMSAANGLKWISFGFVFGLFIYGIVAKPIHYFLKKGR
jgi:hypothetical protein